MNYKHRLAARPFFPMPSSAPRKRRTGRFARFWRILRKSFERTLMMLGFMVFVSTLMGLWTFSRISRATSPKLPPEIVLVHRFEGDLAEVRRESFPGPFGSEQPVLSDLIRAINEGTHDERVKGLVVGMRSGSYSLAHIQELNAAIDRFREAGKFALIYARSYGSFGTGLGQYYLASAFDEIWLQPVGTVSLSGLRMESPFFKDVLGKIGVEPEFFHRKEYKSAVESFTRTGHSEPAREMLQSLLDDLGAQVTEDIARRRNLDAAFVKEAIGKGLLVDEDALKDGFIDKIDYADTLLAEVNHRIGLPKDDDSAYVLLEDYLSVRKKHGGSHRHVFGKTPKKREEVALIHVDGTILDSEHSSSSASVLMQEGVAGASEILSAIDEAAEDPGIRAIILRINSPGGSPTASEAILRSIVRAQGKGLPVIVSMGPVAASGGYWVAAKADRIFALPSTLTGSIGVFGGKFNLADLWDKIGLRWDSVGYVADKAGWSFNTAFKDQGKAEINRMLDAIYEAFLVRVSEGRKMDKAAVDAVAGGRVWSGQQALEKGLVDELGGLDSALDFVAHTLGLESGSDLDVVVLPRPKTPIEQILEILGEQARAARMASATGTFLEELTPLAGTLERSAHPENYAVYMDLP